MARRRKRSTHKKRRRVSGIGAAIKPSSPVVQIAALAAGYFLSDKINEPIDKLVPTSTNVETEKTMQWVKPGAKVALGGFLLMKRKKSLLTTIPGGLLAGAGLKQLLVKAGVVNGFQAVPVIAGYQATPVIAGMPPQLSGYRVNGNGMPSQLSGYRVNGNERVMGSMGSVGNATVPGSDYMG